LAPNVRRAGRPSRLGVRAALVDGQLVSGDCEVVDGRIARAGLGGAGARGGASARRGIASPGFVDLHVNGFAGVDFQRSADYATASAAMLETGVVAYRPTFVTASEPDLVAAVAAVPAGDPMLLGAHLEGPFLAPGRLGVHPAAHRRDPDVELLGRLLDAGPVTQVTLAPELGGAGALLELLHARGVLAAAGHTDATAEQAHAAFDRGVGTVVHLFNAMRPPSARDPGIAFAALTRAGVTAQLIADRVHVADDTLRVAFAAAPGRVALATDATAAAAAPDGPYTLGDLRVTARAGVVRDADGRLAGSALTMDAAVRNAVAVGVPLAAALAAASTIPARLAAVHTPPGVVVLDDRLEVVRVVGAGRPGRAPR
jgi:N-acetylglucosamine-6-phosphate deacetylase